MKYRLAGVTAAVLIVVVAVLLTVLKTDNDQSRYHQHQMARQPDAGCDCDGSELCTHLPLVIIDTGGQEMPGEPIRGADGEEIGSTLTAEGEKMLNAHISILSDDAHNHHPSDDPDLESDIQIRIRGNSSRYFNKNNYLVRLVDEDGDYRS